ncbi:MAB_1171c family putative transporter [Dactylosporangium sp. NPDC048998]|uniref:MAB_1171c family putative transporter n=1 Tax=Dactylosporangium sp. NPDC048998 TaxID=3363976 RepID=UPI00372452B5
MIAFFNIAYPLCALLGFATCAYKIRDLRRDPANPALIALTLARAFPALSFTFATPAVYLWVDRLTRTPNFSTLLVYEFIVANSVTAQVLLLLWSRPAEAARGAIRRRIITFALAMAVMAVLFAAADRSGEHPIDFDVHFARHGPIAGFLSVYLIAFGAGLILSALMTWRFSTVVPQPWLRYGLRLNAVGALFGLGYTVGKAMSIVARWRDVDTLDTINVLWAPLSACIGAILIAVSSSLPAWAPEMAARYRRWQWYRRLEPLWLTVRDTNPAVILDPIPHRFDRWNMRRLDDRLYRRVIEIRDVLLASRAEYSEADSIAAKARAEAAGLSATQVAAIAEAARIAPALRSSNELPAAHFDTAAAPTKSPATGGIDAEAEWLSHVSHALAHSPFVRTPGADIHAGTDA